AVRAGTCPRREIQTGPMHYPLGYELATGGNLLLGAPVSPEPAAQALGSNHVSDGFRHQLCLVVGDSSTLFPLKTGVPVVSAVLRPCYQVGPGLQGWWAGSNANCGLYLGFIEAASM